LLVEQRKAVIQSRAKQSRAEQNRAEQGLFQGVHFFKQNKIKNLYEQK